MRAFHQMQSTEYDRYSRVPPRVRMSANRATPKWAPSGYCKTALGSGPMPIRRCRMGQKAAGKLIAIAARLRKNHTRCAVDRKFTPRNVGFSMVTSFLGTPAERL